MEDESIRLTGNMVEDNGEERSAKGLLPSKWTPKGTIKIWDEHIGTTTTYTQVVVDLIDYPRGENTYPNNGFDWSRGDLVFGYTLLQIENALKGAKTFNQWRDNLKNKYNNATEQHVDALFTLWN